MSASVPPQTEAIDDEPFDSRISDKSRIVYGNLAGTGITAFSDRSANMPRPSSRRPGNRLHLSDRERREVVVEHKLLRVLAFEYLDLLLIGDGPEGRDYQGLRLAALEDGRAVRARQDAHLAVQRADLLEVAAVESLARERQFPKCPILQG